MLITVEDTPNRASVKLQRAIEEIKKLLIPVVRLWLGELELIISRCLFQTDGEDELKKRQLMELAIINGTYRDSSQRNSK